MAKRRPVPRRRPVAAAGVAPGGNAALYRHSVWLFLAFAAAMVAAFWPTYFTRIGTFQTHHAHTHGVVMMAWCALLVAQAWLIRSGRRALHHRVGTLTYLLVPLIIVTTIQFIHFRVRGLGTLSPSWLYALALILNALVVFVILVALAIRHKRDVGTHARYMVATIFPLFTPVTDRLIAINVPALVPLVPVIGGDPVLPVFGFALADLMLVGLTLWDLRRNGRFDVFPVALALLLAYHMSVLTFHRFAFWASFGQWFAGLPLP